MRWQEAAALLSNNDPGDSEAAAAAKQRLDDGKAKDKQQATARGEPESGGVSGDAAK